MLTIMYTCIESSINQLSSIHPIDEPSLLSSLLLEFCSRYDTITTGMLLASWPTDVLWDLETYFLVVGIPTDQYYLLLLCSKATCNVTIMFHCLIIYIEKNFHG